LIEETAPNKPDDDLDILPLSAISSILALSSPLLTAPVADVVKKILEIMGAK
jgi:hypothetical protein